MKRHQLNRNEAGFSLLELLLAMVIGTMLIGVVSMVIFSTMRNTERTSEHLVSSSGAFRTSNRFADDVNTAGTGRTLANPTGVTLFPISRSSPGCGNESAAVVMTGPSATGVTKISYHQVGSTLVRRTCEGATDAAALASTSVSSKEIVDDLAPSGLEVTCRASATSPVNPAPPDPSSNDEQCRIVTMAVTTTTGYSFTVEGTRTGTDTPGQAAPEPPVKKQCTLFPSGDTTVSSHTNEWTLNLASADRDGAPVLAARQGAGALNRRFFYVKFDLGSPCVGENEPTALEAGVDIVRADFSLYFYDIPPQGGARGDDKRHEMLVLGDGAVWGEHDLTFENSPWRSQPNMEHFIEDVDISQPSAPLREFTVYRNPQSDPANCEPHRVQCRISPVDVTQEVIQWYRNAVDDTTGWRNNGWLIRREPGLPFDRYDDYDRGYRFGSRESTPATRPLLVIEWA